MKRFDGVLLASDYDGTMYCGGNVGQDNIDAIRYFEENGGRFTMATGRHGSFVMAQDFPVKVNAPVICVNGTMLYDHERCVPLEVFPMSTDCMEELKWAIDNHPFIQDVSYVLSDDEAANWMPREEIYPHLMASGRTDQILKMVIHPDTPEHTLELQAEWLARLGGRFSLERSWDRGVELFRAGTGKGFLLARLKERLHADLSVAVGDYENDITLLRMADIGYAVSNALPCTLAAADRVTVSGGENALAKIIFEL